MLDTNAPSALRASLHRLCLTIAGKKADVYVAVRVPFLFLESEEVKVPTKLTYSFNNYVKMHPIFISFICKELTAKVPDIWSSKQKNDFFIYCKHQNCHIKFRDQSLENSFWGPGTCLKETHSAAINNLDLRAQFTDVL